MKVFNFDAAKVIDHSISQKEIEYGVDITDYPCHNDIYASKHVLDYIESQAKAKKSTSEADSLQVYTLAVSGSRNGMRYRKKINPFKEDVFAFGMTLLQLTKNIGEEELMGIRDLIANEQYSEVFSDVEYSFLVKVYLRILLTNNSDERPDFLQARKLYDQLFQNPPEVAAELNETLELSVDLDN